MDTEWPELEVYKLEKRELDHLQIELRLSLH